MKEKVLVLRQEYRDLQQMLQDPDVFNDQAEVMRIGRRMAELEPLANLVSEYERCERAIADEHAHDSDPELAEMAHEEAELSSDGL